MSRIAKYVKKNETMQFIPFITAGDPSAEATIDLALMLQSCGACAIELGIPYSDPLADGPVIQRASLRALEQGMTLSKAMNLVTKMRERGLEIPVIIFTYYNLLLQLGESEFFQLAKLSDIDGLLVPDLPFEESEAIRMQCEREGMSLISLVAPTTSLQRLKKIGANAQGFLYCVSSLGVTGVRSSFHPEVFSFLKRVSENCDLPVAVGFGISTREQVEVLDGYCDGIIVGSAIVKLIEAHQDQLLSSDKRQAALNSIKKTLMENLL